MALTGTITLNNIRVGMRKRRVDGTIVIGDGVATYTVGGIALPAATSFGFYRQMDTFVVMGSTGAPGTTPVYYWTGSTTNKLQLFNANIAALATAVNLTELTGAAVPAAATIAFEAWGW